MSWRIVAGPGGTIMVVEECPESGASAERGPYRGPVAAREAIHARKTALVHTIDLLIRVGAWALGP